MKLVIFVIDIKEIGGGRMKCFSTFAVEYLKARSHDGLWREEGPKKAPQNLGLLLIHIMVLTG
ncbi:hypothetical protein BW716_31615 [[Flexibacter] sp. ATCC 35208]|nr:hypothetical protein BW716_31615 [[Flexibacter] sp. ATCC 35208]